MPPPWDVTPCWKNEKTCQTHYDDSGMGDNITLTYDWKHFIYEDYDRYLYSRKCARCGGPAPLRTHSHTQPRSNNAGSRHACKRRTQSWDGLRAALVCNVGVPSWVMLKVTLVDATLPGRGCGPRAHTPLSVG